MVRTLALAALLLLLAPGGPLLAGERWEPGSVLPDIELPTIEGDRTMRLTDLRGQRVLLLQFASW